MAGASMLSVSEALTRILAAASPLADHETVALRHAFGRTLAQDLIARRTQPPCAVSAMDGYALRAADIATPDQRVRLVGESAAGRGYGAVVQSGETIRIFTGAPVPEGVDTVLIQEEAHVEGALISAATPVVRGRHIRAAGLDFRAGEVGLAVGVRLGPAELALAAAMNYADVSVVQKPRVAILATGDELVAPGETPGPDQIVCSNPYAVAAYVEGAGGIAIDLGIAGDDFPALERAITRAKIEKADVLVTLGGASVGDHDLVQSALAREGMTLGFWRIAMRPGKPLIHGSLPLADAAQPMHILGLPGNPVSSIVCTLIYLVPLLHKLLGNSAPEADQSQEAFLGCNIKANDKRQDFLRAALSYDSAGRLIATPHEIQDSSLLRLFSQSQALLLRPPFSPAGETGDVCRILRLSQGGF